MWHKAKTLLDAICMRAADGVIVCSADLAGRIQRWCPRGVVRYVPNGVHVPAVPTRETARQALDLPADDFVLAYVGRLSPEKRPDRVLTLVADARTEGLAFNALIVGSGPLRGELEQQAAFLGVRDAVRFAGFVADVGSVYGAVDALVLHSDTEATSRVVIEAMSAGVPVLASAVGGVPELLDRGRAGWLVFPDDREGALVALRELMARPQRFVGVARQRAVKYYGIETMSSRVTEFYEEVMRLSEGNMRPVCLSD